jgi:hypothetical protein
MTASRASLHPSSVALPDLVSSAVTLSTSVADWGTNVNVIGKITNQGGAAVTAPVEVQLYASPYAGVGRYSVPVGTVTIPAGLAAWVNPQKTITESNYRNDKDLGVPYAAAELVIEAPNPASLSSTTLAVSNTSPTWGSTITVTTQITNNGTGSSPQTRALISLTPQGIGFGTWSSVGIGNIEVPPLAPSQTVNLVQNITLPAVAPNALTNYTNFTLSLTQDADYVTNITYPHLPTVGVGADQTPITITTSSTSTATAPAAPDLAAASLIASASQIAWGSSFQVSTTVQNLGAGAAGQFLVRYVLVGLNGSSSSGIFLGQSTISGLAPGASDPIDQTLKLPTRIPSGLSVTGTGYARIEAVVDPENVTNDPLTSNNTGISAPLIVRLPGNATSVPTTKAANALPSLSSVQEATLLAERAAKRATRDANLLSTTTPVKTLRLPKLKSKNSIVDRGVDVAKTISNVPTQVYDALKKIL